MFGIFENLGWALEGAALAVEDVALKADAKVYETIHASKPVTIDEKNKKFFSDLVNECSSINSSKVNNDDVLEELLKVTDYVEKILIAESKEEEAAAFINLCKLDIDKIENRFEDWINEATANDDPEDPVVTFSETLKLFDEEEELKFYLKKSKKELGDKIISIIKTINENPERLNFIKNLLSLFGNIDVDFVKNSFKAKVDKPDIEHVKDVSSESGKSFGDVIDSLKEDVKKEQQLIDLVARV